MRKPFQIGGVIAGAVLIAFGIAAIYMGVDGRTTVRDSIKQEQIVFGAADDPAVANHASQWAGEPVTNGTQARAFALVIREHALEASGGLAYAQIGRFVSADDPKNLAGTSDEAAALKDETGSPVSTSAPRDLVANALSPREHDYWPSRLPCSGSSSESRFSWPYRLHRPDTRWRTRRRESVPQQRRSPPSSRGSRDRLTHVAWLERGRLVPLSALARTS